MNDSKINLIIQNLEKELDGQITQLYWERIYIDIFRIFGTGNLGGATVNLMLDLRLSDFGAPNFMECIKERFLELQLAAFSSLGVYVPHSPLEPCLQDRSS
jgi:hypothetical protein